MDYAALDLAKRFKALEALEIGPDLASSRNWPNPDLASSQFYRLAITKNPILMNQEPRLNYHKVTVQKNKAAVRDIEKMV